MAKILHTLRYNVQTAKKSFISQNNQVRSFWEYVNMMFNGIDKDRLKTFGPDRVCAEWVLRNGGKIIWEDGTKLADYNALPPERQGVKRVREIDAGCSNLRKIILHNCAYIQDKALQELSYGSSTLTYVQISKCVNVTDAGVKSLISLTNLETLVLFSMENVSDLEGCKEYLKQHLPKCNIRDDVREIKKSAKDDA